MMDKTGTLTEGNFSVNHYESFKNDLSNDTILPFRLIRKSI